MDIKEELEKVKNEMTTAKEEVNNSLVVKEKEAQPLAATKNDGEDTAILLKEKKKQALGTDIVSQLANRIAEEDIKADFANEAARINKKNMDAAETELDNKTRQRRLDRLNSELDLQHKYNMSMIKQNGEHKQMLDRRKKLVEKYGYLYDWKDPAKAIDGENREYDVPKDFSYSPLVNKFRQFGRNLSKLDKPFLQTIKWFLIIGIGVAAFFILKSLGILN